MKIAVATISKDEAAQISPVGGRSPFYLIFDEKGKLLESFSNPFAIGGGGAGFAVAKMVTDKGANIIIAGTFGPNMIGALEERGLKYYEMSGNAKKAVLEVASK